MLSIKYLPISFHHLFINCNIIWICNFNVFMLIITGIFPHYACLWLWRLIEDNRNRKYNRTYFQCHRNTVVLVTFRTDDKCTESKMGPGDRDGQPKESVSSREHQGQWTKPRQSTVKSNKYRRGQIGPSCNQSLVRYTHTLYVSVCQQQVNINTGQ